ncbi:tail fiber protein [Gordonia phage BritBrat]|uniref:Uncharacterized protein n=1 Tax=Gordonia phage BritBrat TaxID=1838064 RepID=A0A166Y000_9CAUD|nr:tail fiber protein [Gordonia phage BritBrat]ANA85260.1 hypothetical protein PBI_BRITBRAT_57 [Gordonia phage BritBrat]
MRSGGVAVTAIHPDALLAAMPNLDAQVACEYDDDCPDPAAWRVRAHGRRRATDPLCGDHRLLICDPHLAEMRAEAEDGLPYECADCGLIAVHVSDVVQSVVAL